MSDARLCLVHCRIKPYWIKAARCARRGRRQRPASALGGPAERAPTLRYIPLQISLACPCTQTGLRIAVFLARPIVQLAGHRV
jgi:hypothetical protein